MAKMTRKIDTPGTEPSMRHVRRKATPPAAHAPVPKTATTVKARTKAPVRTTRKSSTAAIEPAMAADRPVAAPAKPEIAPTHHEIAERAYHIYLRRDGRPGNPDHDWLQAVEELHAERRRSANR